MKEFFGFGGFQREPEGYFSWQHLTFVTSLMVIMVILAVLIGKANKNANDKKKNVPLIFCAILIDAFEIVKIAIMCLRANDPMGWVDNLPLFLCSIQLITIPMAAFCKGRLKEASLDFVMIFGLLGALLGTYFAGQNYSCYPVFSLDNVVSGITHSISGFCSLYIMISRMNSMKKKNMIFTYGIFTAFCITAYIVNIIIDYNYMFLMRPDGTPFEIVYSLVSGNKVLYPVSVALLMLFYIFVYYAVYYFIMKIASSSERKKKLLEERLETVKNS